MYRLALFLILFSLGVGAQPVPGQDPFDVENDDLNIGGDIFNDFNEDIEDSRIAEDERFYRYGRFFTVQFGIGLTDFDGNRGAAYENSPPSFGLSVNYFMNFQSAFGLGVAFSRHSFFVGAPTQGFPRPDTGIGLIDINMFRVHFHYRYYINTADLGTAITFSNPYFTARVEHWNVTNKFEDQSGFEDDSGGGLGVGLGFGLEFPIKLRETYINTEFLWHSINFHDKFTQNFRQIPGETFGFEDLTGNVYTVFLSYVINW